MQGFSLSFLHYWKSQQASKLDFTSSSLLREKQASLAIQQVQTKGGALLFQCFLCFWNAVAVFGKWQLGSPDCRRHCYSDHTVLRHTWCLLVGKSWFGSWSEFSVRSRFGLSSWIGSFSTQNSHWPLKDIWKTIFSFLCWVIHHWLSVTA